MVQECIEDNGVVSFQNDCRLSMREFLELLKCYLHSMFVLFEWKLAVQNSGVVHRLMCCPCAEQHFPVIFHFDRRNAASLDRVKFVKIVRYVGDYLLFYQTDKVRDEFALEKALNSFKEKDKNLAFTSEVPVEERLQPELYSN